MENNNEFANKKKLGRGLGSLLGASASTGAAFRSGASVHQDKSATNQMASQDSHETDRKQTVVVQEKTVVVEQKIDEDKRVWFVAIDKLVPGRFQPRKKFDKETLVELAQSIKENGILQPIVVRKRTAGGYEIIAGERRWRAAQIAGMHEIPALIKTFSDQEALQMALIENIQREDLDPIEEAESYQRLIEEFNLSQQQAAEKVGKERSSVANALRLLALPNEIKDMVSDKHVSVGHAKVLLSLENKQHQIKFAKMCAEKNLSVRALEQTIKQHGREQIEKDFVEKQSKELNTQLAQQLAQNMQKMLGTKTEIQYNKGKGHLTIHFYSDDQLNSIYERLTK